MLRLLPLVLVILLIAGASVYFIFFANRPTKPITPLPQPALDQLQGQRSQPSTNDSERIQLLTTAVLELKDQLDVVKKSVQTNTPVAAQNTDDQLKALRSDIANLETELAAVQGRTPTTNTTPSASTTTSTTVKPSTVFIPLGVGGQTTDQDWVTFNDYEVQIDPANYPSYQNMQLEVNFRLNSANGTGYARLLNATDNSDVGVSVQTTSDQFSTQQSWTFKPASGKKSYKLQVKSETGTPVLVSSARIRVNY